MVRQGEGGLAAPFLEPATAFSDVWAAVQATGATPVSSWGEAVGRSVRVVRSAGHAATEIVVQGPPAVVREVRSALRGVGTLVVRHRTRLAWALGGTLLAVWTLVLATRCRQTRRSTTWGGAQVPLLQQPAVPVGGAPPPGTFGEIPAGELGSPQAVRRDGQPMRVAGRLLAHLRLRACFRTRDRALLISLVDAARRWGVEHRVSDYDMAKVMPVTVALAFILSPQERQALDVLQGLAARDTLRVARREALRTDHAACSLWDVLLGRATVLRWLSQYRGPSAVGLTA